MKREETPVQMTPAQSVARLEALAEEHTPHFSKVWRVQRDAFGERWVRDVANHVSKILGDTDEEPKVKALLGYAEFATDGLRFQQYFEEHGKYRFSRVAEVQEPYLDNEAHMTENYLPGLYLSHFLWQHHYRLLEFFRKHVLAKIQTPKMFYDIGPGTGLYSLETLLAFPSVKGRGFDLSEYSVGFTRMLLDKFGVGGRYAIQHKDAFDADLPAGSADFVVCQEVLEHLEDPQLLCERLYGLCRKGGEAYITAAINAGHSDHIYLFRSPDEVEHMLRTVGWSVVESRAELAYDGRPLKKTPCVAGFFCRKNS